MLLTLKKIRETRYGWHCRLEITNHIFGNRRLSDVFVPHDQMPLELIYPVSITRSGIWLRNQHIGWCWPKGRKRKVILRLRSIQSSREEIRMEITKKRPKWSDEPYFPR